MHGNPGTLARDVPERDVDRRETIDKRTTASEYMKLLLQIDHELAERRGVPPDDLRREHRVDDDFRGRDCAEAESLAAADGAGVGRHLDDQRVDRLQASPPPNRLVGPAARRERDPQWDGLDGGDFHWIIPPKQKIRCSAKGR